MGHDADPAQAGEARRTRHAARLRRAHERHELRRVRAACFAGKLRRWAARLREDRGPDRAGCRCAHHQPMISDEEMAKRKAAWVPPPPRYERGYGAMFS